jgi:hypothetical protein
LSKNFLVSLIGILKVSNAEFARVFILKSILAIDMHENLWSCF